MADSDDVLLVRLRTAAEEIDPVPDGLVDRMITAVAMADLSHEYALLTLIENADSPVRGESETTTVQFSDGRTSILLHVSRGERGYRRVDGWVDAGAIEVRLTQGERSWHATPDDHGRFVFTDVPAGLSQVLLVTGEGAKDLRTPQFEV